MLPLDLLINTLLDFALLFLQAGLDLLHPLLVGFLQGLVMFSYSLFGSFKRLLKALLTLLPKCYLGFLRFKLSFQLVDAGLPEFLGQI